jgi:tetratricopeptide (TPR) repeat protein
MAEEEEQRHTSGSDAAALAASLANRANPDAREYLRAQTRLADLQAEELNREDRVRHWSLRVRHISDVLKLGFELALAFIVIAIAVGLGAEIWQAAHADGLVIESFNVPADMAAHGLSGQVVAAKLLDRLTAIQNASESSRPAASFSNDWTHDIKVEIPETGVSLGELERYLHNWLGNEMHLSGDVYETANGVALTVRLDDAPGQTFVGNDLDKLMEQAAEAVFRRAQPYRYAGYIGPHEGRTAEAVAILNELARTGSAEDRAWANDALGGRTLYLGDYARARIEERRALQADPELPYPQVVLFFIDSSQSHDAEAVADLRQYVTLLKAYGAQELGTSDIGPWVERANALMAQAQGDYREAATDLLAGSDFLPDPSRAAYDFALSHDPAAARTELEGFAPGADVDVQGFALAADATIARAMMAMDVADWRGSVVYLEQAEAQAHQVELHGKVPFSDRVYREVRAGPWLALSDAEMGANTKADTILKGLPSDCDICDRMRGRIDALRHKWSAAAWWFAKVSARSPGVPFADTDWGAMLMAKGDFDDAIAKFPAANQKGPHFADPLEMWGEALIAKNRSDLALAKFAEADKYAPNWGRLHLKWGEALLWSGDKTGAQKQFAIATHLDLSAADKAELSRVSAARE